MTYNSIDKTTGQGDGPPKSVVPSISLPKGGGAIRGMGEKFAANPVTGTGSMSVPIATSPGRSGFGPQLSLSYDSGCGNGPFGFGWSLALPQITRKTDKGLPQYRDAEESDVFLLSGAEDLVPILIDKGDGNWEQEAIDPRLVDGQTYRIQRYRPRIEGLFARIERWTNETDPKDVHWRSITKDNILTLYGQDERSRIADPVDPTRIFSWLICETRDDKGNAIRYEYQPEDGKDLDFTQAHEANRGDEKDQRRQANRYIKRIRYGNATPLLVAGHRPTFLTQDQIDTVNWMFEVVFDYDEGHVFNETTNGHQQIFVEASTASTHDWKRRRDPFSSYRAGFEVRTYRLCRRVLMFHHFPDELGTPDCLVRSTDFTYPNEQDPDSARNPVYTFLRAVTQSGYKRQNASYLKRSLPPLEFEYSRPIVQDTVQEVDAESLENLPSGLDGATYQWTDLHGEGIPGILTEQAGSWFYKRNLSPINVKQDKGATHTEAKFAAVEPVAARPNLTLAGGAQFMDLAGDGQLDLVVLDDPMAGFYEHDEEEAWQPFRPFKARLNRDMRDPNLRFVDLDGDGHADVLITEDDAFVWHASLAEDGFGPAHRVAQLLDEEKGPRLVFADGTQSIYLADMSGDGLTDLVRIRNGEVCYWPNLGYARFGAKVTMDFPSPTDHPSCFDHPDQFDHKRIRLADIDGSGTTDIIYLHREGVRLIFNQSGNSWSVPQVLSVFPRVDDLVSIMPTDLLGNGTACLVWSSPLPDDAGGPMRYVDLMGGQRPEQHAQGVLAEAEETKRSMQKPHLLVSVKNNLGAETRIQYAPSTKFYLLDKQAGKPWITKLPFPVHVVEKVTVTDVWRKTSFTTTYSYHHGYFDGKEREFRGFGRVEQVDVEDYGTFATGNKNSPYITDEKRLYQPPVKTVSWFHTGAFLDRERIISHFKDEYFPQWLAHENPGKHVQGTFKENALPEPELDALDLTTNEWREALRACKGMLLRQEVYELELDALVGGAHERVRLFSTGYHNCHIHRVQPQASNHHAVFHVTESEAITYHYELDLRPENLKPDPRIAHTLNLRIDEYGNIQQSVAVVYPRFGKFEDGSLKQDELTLILKVQNERHLAYTETRHTKDFLDTDDYRLRLPHELITYELSIPDARNDRYFTLEELRKLRLSTLYAPKAKPADIIPVSDIPYQAIPDRTNYQKRLVEHARTLYFSENLVDPLPFGEHGRLGLPYENYKLALTESLLETVFKDAAGNNKLDQPIDGASSARAKLSHPETSGYLSGAKLAARFAGVPAAELAGQYWIRSGIAGFAPDAAQHFYLPERYTDPFDNLTTLAYDPHDLFVMSSTDAMHNTTRVTKFDFRMLAAREMQDINDNLSEVFFDVLGLPTAMVVKGKGSEGDNLTGFDDTLANPKSEQLTAFFVTEKPYDEAQARAWLGHTTARHIYYLGETEEKLLDGTTVIRWGQHPACACGILRERHQSQLAPGEKSPLQAAFEYSDGMGSVIVKKLQAEPEKPGQPMRWVANGKTILNNKGKPVKQYEPYFSLPEVGHRFEEPREEGVTPVIYYDAVGRTVRTELPDGCYSRVEFSPWHVKTYDANDTAFDTGPAAKHSDWYERRTDPVHEHFPDFNTPENLRAATAVEAHGNTPSLTILDSLGRDVISIAHNRVKDAAGALKDEKYLTFTKLDTEGKPLWIRDARGNLVMQYITPIKPTRAIDEFDQSKIEKIPTGSVPCYDIAGNLLFQHSMDAGDRWMINDAAGKPMLAWDNQSRLFRTDYDALHRPVGFFVKGIDPLDANRIIQFEKVIYGDTPGNGLSDTPANDQTRKLNLRGKPYQHYDTAGLVISLGHNPATGIDEAFDFKGNPLRSMRQLVKDYKNTPDWSQNPTLEAEIFTSSTRYDALSRPIQLVAPHSDQPGAKFNVIRPGYNEANLLEHLNAWLEQDAEPVDLLQPTTASLHAVANIDYNAKGQRVRIEYNEVNHPIITEYTYDKETFRLIRLLSTRPKHLESDKRILQDLSYTYDPVGNITAIRDEAQQTVFFDNSIIEPSNAYVYDALYRLVRAEGREHAAQNNTQRDAKNFEPIVGLPFPNSPEALQRYIEDYDYDPVGNILGLHHTGVGTERWVRLYQYALDSNRLISTRLPGEAAKLPFYAVTPGYGAKYTYDAHGNMTSMPHLKVMEWDFKDQLHAVQQQVVNNGTGEKTYYVYDAGGQRVRKRTETQDGKQKDERIYLGGFEVYRKYNGYGQAVTLERETLHLMGDKQRVALVETRTRLIGADPATRQFVHYQLSNHLGSAALELDNQAHLLSYEEYHPYGSTAYEAARSQTETPKRYRYTGKERDEESKLSYHGARYYASWLGRWMNCDPVGIKAGLNVYRYTRLNPINFIDPMGTEETAVKPASLTQEQINNIMSQSKDVNDLKLRLGLGPATDEKLSAYLSAKGFKPPPAQTQPAYSGPAAVAMSDLEIATARAQQKAREHKERHEAHPTAYDLNAASLKQLAHVVDPAGAGNVKAGVFGVGKVAGLSNDRAADIAIKAELVFGIAATFAGARKGGANPKVSVAIPSSVVQTTGVGQQTEFFSENIPGITAEQATLLLSKAFARGSNVVVGGSRVKGNQRTGSDLDVGFDSLTTSQAGKVKATVTKLGPLKLEVTHIVPGNETQQLPEIQSAGEFFQRSGVRGPRDSRPGQPFAPSGSITFEPNGEIHILGPTPYRL